MLEIKSPDTALIDIPQTDMDTIWHGLAAIFNAASIPERDSVFDIYCVHNLSYKTSVLSNELTVWVDTNYSWTSHWADMETVTGYGALDSLLTHYGYSIIQYFSGFDVAVLYSNQLLNTFAFCDSLETFDGIIQTESTAEGFDGSRIIYTMTGDEQFFDFTVAWGDCYAGCAYGYTWKFKVNFADCSAEYLGELTPPYPQPPLPEPANCNITGLTEPVGNDAGAILIYPNPAGDYFQIELPGQYVNSGLTIEMVNIVGSVICSTEMNNITRVIDLNGLQAGLYLVRILNGNVLVAYSRVVKN